MQTFPIDWKNFQALRTLQFSSALSKVLVSAATDGDIIHSHGIWRMPNVYPSWAVNKKGVPLIISPHGMLAVASMRYSTLRKGVFWALVQHNALEAASMFHATSDAEVRDIRRFGFTAPVAMIPLGVDIPIAVEKIDTTGPRVVLHLGRLHPKKGTEYLIASWAGIERDFPDWQLLIIGPSERHYAESLKSQVHAAGLERVFFRDGVFGNEKADILRRADLFVLPTLAENFGLVVAEALASGVPVICTKGAPWEGLQSYQCGWWIDHGIEPLKAALRMAMGSSAETLAGMGNRGRDWMIRDYSWQAAATQMTALYFYSRNGGPQPTCLRTD